MKTMLIAATMAMTAISAQAYAQASGRPMIACKPEVVKFCADKAAGPERRQCVMANYSRLSDGCKSAISAMLQQRQAAKAASAGAPATPARR